MAEKGILIAGTLGADETARLARQHAEELAKFYSNDFLNEAFALGGSDDEIITAAERFLSENGLISRLDKKGFMAALWDAAEYYGCGLEVEMDRIPVAPQTVEICEQLELDPYELASGGALLIITEDPLGFQFKMSEFGVRAGVVGRLRDSAARIMRNGDRVRYLNKPRGSFRGGTI